ncbi:hypothetical protein M758_9G105000 [Ceratodon purpureus]|nr:hypothetical protein M758_9G105000 [Ceratodon purpureus]KAG0606000.1 hypothetical protein M758_9G105000 [Ceratodon purpureus]
MIMAAPSLGALLVIATTILVIYLVNLLWRRRNLPPGPWGLPIIGCMHMLGPRPHHTFQKMAEKYGPLMSLRIGQKLFIVASSGEAAKEFFKFHDANFSSRPFKRAFQVLMPNDIAFVEGNSPLRRHLRKIFQLELTSAKRIQETEHVRSGEMSKMIKAIPENSAITIRHYIEVMVTNVLSLMVFKKQYLAVAGKEVSSTTEEIKEIEAFKRILSDIAVNISKNNIGDVVPALRRLDPQGLESQYREVKERMDSFSSKIIAEHQERRHPGARLHSLEHEKDLIDIFLDQVEEEKKHEVTLENVQSILWNAIAAGLAPIVAASEWALAETLRNPHILEKAQAELDDVVGKSRRVQESDIPKLKYTQAIVKEAFRLHPAPMPPPHESMEPCKVFGYDIPAKTGLLCNFYAIQRDPAVWHKPLDFDPSRFLEGSPTASISVSGLRHFDLIPFGSGRRSCPAIEMGQLMVNLITANLLHAFDWSVPDRRQLEDDTEDVDHTASRAVAVTAIVKRRLPSDVYT